MRIFLATVISVICLVLGLMLITWATSMAFQLLNFWVAVILFFMFTLSSIVGVSKLCLLNIPFLYFKIRTQVPSLFSGIMALVISIISLLYYKELNSFYFPNWVYIVLYSGVILTTLSSLLNLPKVIASMKKFDYDVLRDKIIRRVN
jgi:hypothetical protein